MAGLTSKLRVLSLSRIKFKARMTQNCPRSGAGKLIWGEGLPDPVVDVRRSVSPTANYAPACVVSITSPTFRAPGETEKKSFDLTKELPSYVAENTI